MKLIALVFFALALFAHGPSVPPDPWEGVRLTTPTKADAPIPRCENPPGCEDTRIGCCW